MVIVIMLMNCFRGILGENLDERKRAEDEKKKMYQMELQRQVASICLHVSHS